MIINNSKVIAEEGKYLLLSYDNKVYDSVVLGNRYILINDVPTSINITINDVTEVYKINIPTLGNVFVKSTTYEELISELIRLKYSLDDELALIANSRLNPNNEEEREFQEWRLTCKQIAKNVFNK